MMNLAALTNHMSSNEGQQANLDFLIGVGKILLPFAAAYFGYVFGGWRERNHRIRRAKEDFLAVVSSQQAKLENMRSKEAEFFEQSVPVVTQAAYEIRPFLTPDDWDRLSTILKDYQSGNKNAFAGTSSLASALRADEGTGKTTEQTFRDLLKEFCDCVHYAD
jgi:hypothetical protein